MDREIPDPLPSEWLPKPSAPRVPDDPEVLDIRIRRLMTAAEPTLARFRTGAIPWWAMLARHTRPAAAAALAAAAGLLIALGLGRANPSAEPETDLVLVVAASDGSPAALWSAMGAEADPVLALIALETEPK